MNAPYAVVVLQTDRFVYHDDGTFITPNETTEIVDCLRAQGLTVAIETVVACDMAGALAPYAPDQWLVLNFCEDWNGDGMDYATPAQLITDLGFFYTGCPADALQRSQFKDETKRYLIAQNIPTPHALICHEGVVGAWTHFPAIVKPASQHCSFGITRASVVDTPAMLAAQVAAIYQQFGGVVLVEEFIDGIEFNVSLWGNGDMIQVLPLSSIDYSPFADYHDRLCTYDGKWKPGSFDYETPIWGFTYQPDTALRMRIHDVAIAAFRAIGLRDYGRVDLRVYDGVPYVFDVNANPDITRSGGMYRAAAQLGMDYGAFLRQLLDLAYARKNDSQ
jgi:D-alanine-D-alanine ligase